VFFPYTSNVNGYFYNTAWSVDGPFFVSLAPATMTGITFNPFQSVATMTTTSAAGAPSSTLTTAAAAVVIIVIVAIAAVVLRSRSKKTAKT